MRFWSLTLTFRPRVPEMMFEHEAVLDRLRAHDVPGARKAMKAHIDAFRASISLRLR
jgi:DNA-binding GntR family transcriptional regulator